MASSVELILSEVGRWFGYRVLFRGVQVELGGGETCLVSGPNGSGKSTLIRMMAGVLRASEGEIMLRVDGQSIANEERPLHSMLIAPYLGMYRGLTAKENLEFAVTYSPRAVTSEKIDAALERVGLADAAERHVGAFSSGMVQRLRLAIAILRRPHLCLLDEPWMNLDEEGRSLVIEEIARFQEAGSIVVIASNDPLLKRRSYDQEIHIPDYREN